MYYNTEANNGIAESSYKDTPIADILTDLKKEEVFKSIVQLQFSEEKNLKSQMLLAYGIPIPNSKKL